MKLFKKLLMISLSVFAMQTFADKQEDEVQTRSKIRSTLHQVLQNLSDFDSRFAIIEALLAGGDHTATSYLLHSCPYVDKTIIFQTAVTLAATGGGTFQLGTANELQVSTLTTPAVIQAVVATPATVIDSALPKFQGNLTLTTAAPNRIDANVIVTDDVVINEDLTITGDLFILGGSFTVAAGVTLTVNGELLANGLNLDKSVVINSTATVNVKNATFINYASTSGAAVILAGTVNASGRGTVIIENNSSSVDSAVMVSGRIAADEVIITKNSTASATSTHHAVYATPTADIQCVRKMSIDRNTAVAGNGVHADASSKLRAPDIDVCQNSGASAVNCSADVEVHCGMLRMCENYAKDNTKPSIDFPAGSVKGKHMHLDGNGHDDGVPPAAAPVQTIRQGSSATIDLLGDLTLSNMSGLNGASVTDSMGVQGSPVFQMTSPDTIKANKIIFYKLNAGTTSASDNSGDTSVGFDGAPGGNAVLFTGPCVAGEIHFNECTASAGGHAVAGTGGEANKIGGDAGAVFKHTSSVSVADQFVARSCSTGAGGNATGTSAGGQGGPIVSHEGATDLHSQSILNCTTGFGGDSSSGTAGHGGALLVYKSDVLHKTTAGISISGNTTGNGGVAGSPGTNGNGGPLINAQTHVTYHEGKHMQNNTFGEAGIGAGAAGVAGVPVVAVAGKVVAHRDTEGKLLVEHPLLISSFPEITGVRRVVGDLVVKNDLIVDDITAVFGDLIVRGGSVTVMDTGILDVQGDIIFDGDAISLDGADPAFDNKVLINGTIAATGNIVIKNYHRQSGSEQTVAIYPTTSDVLVYAGGNISIENNVSNGTVTAGAVRLADTASYYLKLHAHCDINFVRNVSLVTGLAAVSVDSMVNSESIILADGNVKFVNNIGAYGDGDNGGPGGDGVIVAGKVQAADTMIFDHNQGGFGVTIPIGGGHGQAGGHGVNITGNLTAKQFIFNYNIGGDASPALPDDFSTLSFNGATGGRGVSIADGDNRVVGSRACFTANIGKLGTGSIDNGTAPGTSADGADGVYVGTGRGIFLDNDLTFKNNQGGPGASTTDGDGVRVVAGGILTCYEMFVVTDCTSELQAFNNLGSADDFYDANDEPNILERNTACTNALFTVGLP